MARLVVATLARGAVWHLSLMSPGGQQFVNIIVTGPPAVRPIQVPGNWTPLALP